MVDGTVSVAAEGFSADMGQWQCQMPAMSAGNHTLEVSSNGQDWSVSTGVMLESVGSMNVSSADPAVVLGGSKVTLAGAGFSAARGVYCGVGGSSLDGSSWVYSMGSVVSSSSVECALPSRGDGMRVLEVSSSEGGELSHSGVQVEYVSAARVESVWPSSGSVSGGTVVTLSGEGFVAGQTACRFGSSGSLVAADMLSSSEAHCVSDAAPVGNAE